MCQQNPYAQCRIQPPMDVLDYFHLNEQPFRIGPDPRYLYLSEQVKDALAKCEYMARERVGPSIFPARLVQEKQVFSDACMSVYQAMNAIKFVCSFPPM